LNVALFGFMGVGKTTVGRLLAPRLGYRFVDSDAEAEKALGMRISEAFTQLGEAAFRGEEHRVVGRLSAGDGQVIALGGGAVLDPVNVAALRRTGRMVLLTASPEEIGLRTRGASSRPLLAGGDKLARIRCLLDERRDRYLAAADMVVDTNGVPPIRVAEAILGRLEVAAR
jgi:shikimate kinase